LELHRLDCSSSSGHLENYELAKAKLQEQPPEVLKPAPLITGRDLIEAGYRPGPEFSKMLTAIEDAQLESTIHTKEEALVLLRNDFPVVY
jgi:hypothetical protein